jgi:hypothetical protein
MPKDPAQNTQKNTHKNSPKISVSQAASLLKVSTSTLRRLEVEGKIGSVRETNGYRSFSLLDVIELRNTLEKDKVSARTEKQKSLKTSNNNNQVLNIPLEEYIKNNGVFQNNVLNQSTIVNTKFPVKHSSPVLKTFLIILGLFILANGITFKPQISNVL